jgi:hypothetical protein
MATLILPDRFQSAVPANKSAVVGCSEQAGKRVVLWVADKTKPHQYSMTPYEEFCKRFDLTLEERVDLANYIDKMTPAFA